MDINNIIEKHKELKKIQDEYLKKIREIHKCRNSDMKDILMDDLKTIFKTNTFLRKYFEVDKKKEI